MRVRPMDAGAARQADSAVAMFLAAQVGAFGRRASREADDARELAFGRPQAVTSPRPCRHRAEPLVADDEPLRLGEGNRGDRAAFEGRHCGAGARVRPPAPGFAAGGRQGRGSVFGRRDRRADGKGWSRSGGWSGARRHPRRRRGRRTRPRSWHGLAWPIGFA